MAGTVTKGEKTFLVVNDVVMVVLCAIMIYPILFLSLIHI